MSTWLHLLALALISAISPTSLVPPIALLGSRTGARGVAAYFAGNFSSFVVVTSVAAAGLAGADAGESTTSTVRAAFELAAGLGSMAYAARMWQRRDVAPKEEGPPPRWLGFFDRLGLVGAFLFGSFWIVVVLAVDAGLEIAQAGFSPVGTAVAILSFAFVAASTPLLVLAVYFSDRERADARLAAVRRWTLLHSRAALAAVLFVLGAWLVVNAVYALAV